MRFQKIIFSPEQEAYLREHFPTECASDIADVLKVSAPVVSRIAKELGLEKKKGWNSGLYRGRYVNQYSGKRRVVA